MDITGEELEREVLEEPPTQSSQQIFAETLIKKEEEIKKSWRDAMVTESDEKQEPNTWLGRTGWASHLSGLDRAELLAAAQPAGEEERVLQKICHSLETAIEAAKQVYNRRIVGLAALFEINSRESSHKAKKPFKPQMESNS